MKPCQVIIDLTPEILRQLSAEAIQATVKAYIEAEASLDVKASADFLKMCRPRFLEHAKRIPVVDLTERTQRYRLKDLIAYRDKHIVQPKR